MPQLRKDIVTSHWVIIANERLKRPSEFTVTPHTAGDFFCPFCPENESKTPAPIKEYLNDNNEWISRVIPNKYPVLKSERDPAFVKDPFYESMDGVGEHEIIIESRDHHFTYYTATPDDFARNYLVTAERFAALAEKKHLRYGLYFKNYKPDAGATLLHPHAQIIATPIVPKLIWEELVGAKDYHDTNGTCVFCRIMDEEKKRNERLVTENERFVAISPYASMSPYEIWILPRQHTAEFQSLTADDAHHLGMIVHDIFQRYKAVIGDAAFNAYLHTAPFRFPLTGFDRYFHWHIEIAPKTGILAGFELGSGFCINPHAPEECTRMLKEVRQ
ncbi:MAG: galactose-1-phosphate uridylyltransferase [Spirochaetes bacterium]|nr:galactose-1-phosphate uridylyltransferase [Spirochaetota bacterium]